MKRRVTVSAIFSLAISMISLPVPANAAACATDPTFAGGAGTSYNDPYLIDTAARLNSVVSLGPAGTQGKFFKLTQNIDLLGCTLSSSGVSFNGDFNGNGKVISNFLATGSTEVGLFGVADGAVIANLKIRGAQVSTPGAYAGALVGRAEGLALDNVGIANSTISGGGSYIGGLAGAAFLGPSAPLSRLTVTSSNVTGISAVGGIFGGISGGYTELHTSGVYSTKIDASRAGVVGYVGGLIGTSMGTLSSIDRSSFRGEVRVSGTAGRYVGFLAGNTDAPTFSVTSAYARGVMSLPADRNYFAGFIGDSANGLTAVAVATSNSYLDASFVSVDNPATQIAIHPFASVANFTNAFYSNSTHTSWLPTTNGPTPTAKTSTELRTLSTFPSGAFPVATNTDDVNRGLASEAWFRSGADDGYLFLAHEYRGSNMTPCAVGRYSWNGFDDCILAEPGKFVAFTGRTYQDTCPAGTFSPSTGQTECTPAPAGSYVALPGQAAPISCPAGSFQGQTGQMVCLHANIGFYVPDLGSAVELPCPAGTTTATTGQSACSPVASTSYSGPLVSGSATGIPGGQVTLNGSGLASVTKVSVDGIDCKIVSVTDSSITFTIPSTISSGTKDLVITSSSGSLTVQGALVVSREGSIAAASSSIKRIGDKVRLSVGNAVGIGKVQFLVNGKEVAWVRAVDGSNPKLRNGQYFVRTAKLASGKNLVEIRVAGKILDRASLTR